MCNQIKIFFFMIKLIFELYYIYIITEILILSQIMKENWELRIELCHPDTEINSVWHYLFQDLDAELNSAWHK